MQLKTCITFLKSKGFSFSSSCFKWNYFRQKHPKSHSLPPAVPGPCRRRGWGSCRCHRTEEKKHGSAFATFDRVLQDHCPTSILFFSVIKNI